MPTARSGIHERTRNDDVCTRAAATRPADYGPFTTRQEAEAALGRIASAARTPEGMRYCNRDSLTDTFDMLGAGIGDYERQVLDDLAGQLDRLTVEVLCSMIRRAAHDQPDPDRYAVTSPHERAEILAARP